MILALGTNGALGLHGKLPWSYPEDREQSETTTRGHAVIMGRRTWEEGGRPLPDRASIRRHGKGQALRICRCKRPLGFRARPIPATVA